MLNEALERSFRDAFGAVPQLWVNAPGRVNLIGEHTDYNDGFVLPCAIDLGTQVLASSRGDNRIRVVAQDYDGQVSEFSWDEVIVEDSVAPWSNYVRGVVEVFVKRGLMKHGANLLVSGNIPQGAGLSSSASLEVAVGQVLASLNSVELSGVALAQIGQAAENDFVGCQCGIMD